MDELNEILAHKERLKMLQEEIIFLETLITKINRELSPICVQGSGYKKGNEDLIIKLLEMKDNYLKKSVGYSIERRKVIQKILKIPVKNEMVLIYRRYVLGMKLTEVAKSMKISYKWAQILHQRGVSSYENVVL